MKQRAAHDLLVGDHHLTEQGQKTAAHRQTHTRVGVMPALVRRRARRHHEHTVRVHGVDGSAQKRHMSHMRRIERAAEQDELFHQRISSAYFESFFFSRYKTNFEPITCTQSAPVFSARMAAASFAV